MKIYYCKTMAHTSANLELGFVVVASDETAARSQAAKDLRADGWELEEETIELHEVDTSTPNTIVFDPSN